MKTEIMKLGFELSKGSKLITYVHQHLAFVNYSNPNSPLSLILLQDTRESYNPTYKMKFSIRYQILFECVI